MISPWKFGYTPLMYAICGEHSETVKYIVLNKQANVHLASMVMLMRWI